MERSEARALLGVGDDDDPATLRRAFRRRLRDVHPDLNPGARAGEDTRRLTTAYRALLALPPPPTPTTPPRVVERLVVEVVDDDTLAVHAPHDEALLAAVEAAHRLGEVAYLDPQVGLVEAIVEFVGAPTSSVVMTLQGRGNGTTEVFCSVEPLSGGDSPPVDAVTRLVAETISSVGLSPS